MSLQQNLDAVLGSATTAGTIPGIAALVTDADGTVYLNAFGERELGSGQAMTPDTVFWIASMTKAVTGVAAMQLVEQGRLDLDAPARNVLPEIGELQVLDGFDADGRPRLRVPVRDITLRHLMTHTSGCVYDMWSDDIARCVQLGGIPPIGSRKRAALKLPLLFDPGTRWEYGTGIDWIGLMVEAVSGQTLGEWFAERIFAPLEMTSTGFALSDDMRSRKVRMHLRAADGSLIPQPETAPLEAPEFEMGGGGLFGTVEDYGRFIRMILNRGQANGHQVLRPETVAQMSVNQMGDSRVTMLRSAGGVSNDAEFFPGIEKSWGLSFMINEQDAPTGRAAGSLAWAGLANTYYWIDPKTGIGGVYATQILPFADDAALPHYLAFEKAVYDGLN